MANKKPNSDKEPKEPKSEATRKAEVDAKVRLVRGDSNVITVE